MYQENESSSSVCLASTKWSEAREGMLLSKLALSLEHQTCISKASGSLGPRLSEQCGLQTLLVL